MSVAVAFLRRDFLIWSSYRLAAFWQIAGIFMTLGLVYFAGEALGDSPNAIKGEKGSYVAFILVGLAFMDVLMQGLGSLPRAINENQRAGTLEPMLLAPIHAGALLINFWLFRFLFSTFRMAVLIGLGIIVLGFWSHANPLAVIAVLIPGEITFMAMGAFSAAFMILVKQGDPVLLAYAAVTAVLGGAIFPVHALPSWIEPVTILVPLTHALSGIREGFNGGSVRDVLPQIGMLSAMAVVMLPSGLWTFNWAMTRAKREGTLGEY